MPSGAAAGLAERDRPHRRDVIRVRLTAPPVDGAANDALLRFLAARLEVPRSALTLVSGQAARTKVVALTGVSAEEVGRRLGF